jgi:hypothetical protein
MLVTASAAVAAALSIAGKTGAPKVSELDQRSLDALAGLPPSCALQALDRCALLLFFLDALTPLFRARII